LITVSAGGVNCVSSFIDDRCAPLAIMFLGDPSCVQTCGAGTDLAAKSGDCGDWCSDVVVVVRDLLCPTIRDTTESPNIKVWTLTSCSSRAISVAYRIAAASNGRSRSTRLIGSGLLAQEGLPRVVGEDAGGVLDVGVGGPSAE
jgi:hypothetical protein